MTAIKQQEKPRKKRDAPGQFVVNKGARGVSFGVRFRTASGERVFEKVGQGYGPDAITEAEARERVDQLLARVKLGQYRTKAERAEEERRRREGAVAVPLFADFAAEWLDRRRVIGGQRGTGLSDSAENDLGWRLAHLNGWFGGMRLSEMDEQEVEAYAAAKRGGTLREGGLGATSTNKTLATLETIMGTAVRYRLIDRNPVGGYRVPGAAYKAAHLETAAQIEVLLAAAGKRDREGRGRPGHGRALLAVLVLGGLRLGEALALTWRDVNLADGTLRVRDGKTANAARVVTLVPLLRDDLLALKARRAAERDDLLFGTATGRRESPSNVRRRTLAPAVTAANEELEKDGEELISTRLTPHGLRHTFAACRFYLGDDPGFVAEQLGHADPSFTYSRYWKKWRRAEGEEARVRRLLFGEPEPEAGGAGLTGVAALLEPRDVAARSRND